MEGFWSEENVPVQGNYAETETGVKVIQKLRKIKEKIETLSETEWCKIGMVKAFFKVPQYDTNSSSLHKRIYAGFSHCRLCSLKNNGNGEYVINNGFKSYIVPDGYLHYLQDHGVNPSEEFEKFILGIDLDSLSIPEPIPDSHIQTLNTWTLQRDLDGISWSK